MHEQRAAIESLLRELTPLVVGTVMRRFRDFAAAEDAVQEACLAAAIQWERDGLPDNPRGWLTRVAFRRITDEARAESARRRRENETAAEPLAPEPLSIEDGMDDTLVLIYMCCHPALSKASAIALTLRAVGGLTTSEIAHAYLVPEATMAQRISRAKQTIRASGIPFETPGASERAQRLSAVLHVLYLIFNEGYTASSGAGLHRADLAQEAIRLAKVVYQLEPEEPEVAGLLALMLLTDARRLARTNGAGELVPLDEQDRGLWNREQIDEGVAIISSALPKGRVGPYQLQAAVAAIHDEAASAEQTDWQQILALYELLRRISPNPMAELSYAIASAMVYGVERGLTLLDELEPKMAGHHRVHAARAHLLEMAGDGEGAVHHYRAAAAKTASLPERNYLLTRAARLGSRA